MVVQENIAVALYAFSPNGISLPRKERGSSVIPFVATKPAELAIIRPRKELEGPGIPFVVSVDAAGMVICLPPRAKSIVLLRFLS
jgi:hypothetical protein